MTTPFVSIVTPVYNGEKYLENCINSVLNQTYADFEYVIVDNASTDGTPAIIERFAGKDARIKVYRNPATLKIIDNFNKCIECASPRAKWIKYALADDYLFPQCVSEMVRVGETDPQIGFVSAYSLNGAELANHGLPLGREVANGRTMLKEHLLRRMHVCLDSPNTLLYKRTVLETLNGFDNTFLHADAELAFRILNHHHLGFVHQVLTWTGLNEGRGATYSHFHGLFTREYLQFALTERAARFPSIILSPAEIQEVSDVYANEIALYVATHLVHFLWDDMRRLWQAAPGHVKRRLLPMSIKNGPFYARKLIGSIIHYRDELRSRPTFKG